MTPEWRFMCITGEKNLETVWKEFTEEFEEDLEWMNITKDAIWNSARDREMGYMESSTRPRNGTPPYSVGTEERVTRVRSLKRKPDSGG